MYKYQRNTNAVNPYQPFYVSTIPPAAETGFYTPYNFALPLVFVDAPLSGVNLMSPIGQSDAMQAQEFSLASMGIDPNGPWTLTVGCTPSTDAEEDSYVGIEVRNGTGAASSVLRIILGTEDGAVGFGYQLCAPGDAVDKTLISDEIAYCPAPLLLRLQSDDLGNLTMTYSVDGVNFFEGNTPPGPQTLSGGNATLVGLWISTGSQVGGTAASLLVWNIAATSP